MLVEVLGNQRRRRIEDEALEGGRPWKMAVLLLMAALGLYGLLNVVNAGAYLIGIGPERSVRIERVRTDVVPVNNADGTPSTFVDVPVGEGTYVDGGGHIDLVGFHGQPGDIVRLRQPLLPSWLVYTAHRPVQAVGELLMGLMFFAIPGATLYRILREE